MIHKKQRDEYGNVRIDAALTVVPSVGDLIVQELNQADRDCVVYAVLGDRYAVEYEMPSGVVYRRIGRVGGTERAVSIKALPAWAKEGV